MRNSSTSQKNTSEVKADADTIVAVATPPGRGGVGIVRLSGARAPEIARRIVGKLPPPRHAGRRDFISAEVGAEQRAIDNGLVLYFPAPASYTGEDCIELHAHGGPVVMQMLLETCVAHGARLARAGEFSERAFLNDRMDLAQAEAVADLIAGATRAAAKSALQSLKGEFSARVHALGDAVTQLRVYVESAIDFPDEDIDFLADDEVRRRLQDLQDMFAALRASAKRGKLLRDGLKVVIAGAPNVGKSSLLNALSREQRAIVSDLPGTTRDLLEQHLDINGLPVQITDTAGLRAGADEVEREGVRRAKQAARDADLVLFVVDDTDGNAPPVDALAPEDAPDAPDDAQPRIIVRNKIDLSGGKAGVIQGRAELDDVAVSAKTGAGLDALCEQILRAAGFAQAEEGGFIARQRHLGALARAEKHLQLGAQQLQQSAAGELLAEELGACHRALGEITGEVRGDELLGLIFATFCIGK